MRTVPVVFFIVLLLTAPITAQRPQPTERKNSQSALTAREIAKKALQAVVVIVTEDSNGKPLALGSGFQVRPGIVATNYHVIKGARSARAKFQNQYSYWIGGTVAIDETNDLVLLRLSSSPYDDILDLPLKDRILSLASGPVEIGDTVFAVGNPEGLEGTFSQGIVSALRGTDYIQVTAPISHGSSGGPVLNKYGQVIGVAIGVIEEGQNLNFAIPVSKLVELLNRADDTRVSEWQFVFSSGGEQYYFSRARIRLTPGHTFVAWIKSVPDDSPQGRASRKSTIDLLNATKINRRYSFSYSLDQWEFDCGHRKMRNLLDTAYYDQEGNLLYRNDPSKFEEGFKTYLMEWFSVYPNSSSEEELNFVCKR
ncbi:MAG TPA: S1C family serine protease [Pyrinomonadaceae bacterium]|nr:S1C family serine protease [Pyrinomonadaceae bacterium]